MSPRASGDGPEPRPDAPAAAIGRVRRRRRSSPRGDRALSGSRSSRRGLVVGPAVGDEPTCPSPSPTTPSGRSRGAGTRRSSTRSGAPCPNPPVHARNLFHLSAAMWDAWAAYDPTAGGLLRDREAHGRRTSAAARNEAISYAAYRRPVVALHQGGRRRRLAVRVRRRRWTRCATRSTSRRPRATSPAAVGNRIAAAVLAYGARPTARTRRTATPPRTTRR